MFSQSKQILFCHITAISPLGCFLILRFLKFQLLGRQLSLGVVEILIIHHPPINELITLNEIDMDVSVSTLPSPTLSEKQLRKNSNNKNHLHQCLLTSSGCTEASS